MKRFISLLILAVYAGLAAVSVQAQTTVNISASDWATAQSLNSGDAVNSFTKENVTVSFSQGSGAAVTYNGSAIAAGEGNTLTLTAAEGWKLAGVTFTLNVAAQATRLAGNTWSAGAAAVNSSNNKQVDWTGSAQSVSVTLTGTEVFKEFSVTIDDLNKSFTVTFLDPQGNILKTESVIYGNAATAPTPPTIEGKVFKGWDKAFDNITEDLTVTAIYEFAPSVLNETATILPKEIMDYNELSAGESFENIDYTKGNFTLIIDKGTAGNEYSYPNVNYDYYTSAYRVKANTGNTLTFKAPFKIHKIEFTHYLTECSKSEGCEPHASANTGAVKTVGNTSFLWEGSASTVVLNITNNGYYSGDINILEITVSGDKNDTQNTVRFFDLDGQLIDTQKINDGNNATAPAYSHACFAGWDKSLNNISSDLDIHAVREKWFDLTASQWESEYDSADPLTIGDFTITAINYWGDQNVDFGDSHTDPNDYWNTTRHVILSARRTLTFASTDFFRNLTMVCANEGDAERLIASTYSNGAAKQQGANVIWTGDTDTLVITYPQDASDNCGIFEFIIYCEDYEKPKCTVIFVDAEGNEIKRETVTRGESVTAPAAPAPADDCHYFTGWDKDLSRVREDMTVSPVFAYKGLELTPKDWATANSISNNSKFTDITINGYVLSAPDITYRSHYNTFRFYSGNSLTISSEQEFFEVVLCPCDYAFTCSEGATYCSANGDSLVWRGATKSLTLTFSPGEEYYTDNVAFKSIAVTCFDHFTVTFLDWDGKVLKTEDVKPHGNATAPADPERHGFKFSGWDKQFSDVIGDITVTAQYEEDQSFIKVRFLDFFGEEISVVSVLPGSTATAPEAPALPFHEFIGWDKPLTNIQIDNVIKEEEPAEGIRVKLNPKSASMWNEVYLYVWGDDTGEVLGKWPGTKVEKDVNGWWSYDFSAELTKLNIIWNNGSGSQTVDINNVTESTCYSLSKMYDDKYTVVNTDCPAPSTDVKIRAQYKYISGSEGMLNVQQALDLVNGQAETWWGTKESVYLDGAYAVKGIVAVNPSELEDEGRITIRIADEEPEDGWSISTYIYGYNLPGPDMEAFVSTLQLQKGDTVVLFGKLGKTIYRNPYTGQERTYDGIALGYVCEIMRKSAEGNFIYIDIPDAATMYDFSGNGLKQALLIKNGSIVQTGDINDDFVMENLLYSSTSGNIGDNYSPKFLDDLNHDGKTDIGIAQSYNSVSFMSKEDEYRKADGALFLHDFDANGDGRKDYLIVNPQSYWESEFGAGGGLGYGTSTSLSNYSIAYALPDGNYRIESMQIMTWDEYLAQFNDTEWEALARENTYSSGSSPLIVNYGYNQAAWGLSAASLASAPRRHTQANHAPSIGYKTPFITRALDLNADNLIDFIDEQNGVMYLNMGNSQFVKAGTGGMVVPADLNNDGLMDFLFPGKTLVASVYKGEGEFETKTIYSNAAVDDLLYCYDFDHDGDIDILATFSASTNATGIAYTCFFLNDGQGNFTQQTEQNYGSDDLLFSALQDIDGDGFFDLLAFRAKGALQTQADNQIEVVWLRGSQNNQFAAPQKLYEINAWASWEADALNKVFYGYRINVEDMDNDGKADIWVSGLGKGKTEIIKVADVLNNINANTAPTAPAKPTLLYDNGRLTVTWANGSDQQTQTSDLSYALRIGTTKGGNEVLAAHANADGSRRNFLDGNMGKNHTYSIDLSTYQPATFYVAVQAIDAQHNGSPWSEEASIEHTGLPASFSLSSAKININDSVVVNFTPLPLTYSHTWLYEDGIAGQVTGSTAALSLHFPTAGEKVITHMVTAPDGKQTTFAATLIVLPAGISNDYLKFNDYDEYGNNSINSGIFHSTSRADFNYDGLLDAYTFDYNSNNYIAQAQSLTEYTQAMGLWNTNIIDGSTVWFDWNRNGYADMLSAHREGYDFQYYVLPHADNAPDMTAQVEDSHIIGYVLNNITVDGYNLKGLPADLMNTGLPTVYAYYGSGDERYLFFQLLQSDGSFQYKELTVEGDKKILYEALLNAKQNGQLANEERNYFCDYNRDGWVDVLYLRSEYINNVSQYSKMMVFRNDGDAHFTEIDIPFEQNIAVDDLGYPIFADMNNDGLTDVVAHRMRYDYYGDSDYTIYILWNNGQSMSEPEILPLGELRSFNYNGFSLIDLDNNGYLDIVAYEQNFTISEGAIGLYVWYMGATGLLAQGFIEPVSSLTSLITIFPNEVLLGRYYTNEYGSSKEGWHPVVSVENTKPEAPAGLRAAQTADGLLIEWNAPKDDHTPALQMRYNLSVKHADKTGAGAYIISPQNGGNATSAYLPTYNYISANRFLVPMTAITTGDYEISVQAIDQKNLMSEFSQTIKVNVDRPVIDAPSTVCLGDEILITYMGDNNIQWSDATCKWDFDGGNVTSGTGFGPYRVLWNTTGTKTITLTLNGKTHERMLYVDKVEAWADIPAALFDGGSVEVNWSDGMYGELEIIINGLLQSVTEKGIDNRDPQLTFDGTTLRLDTRKAWDKQNALTNFSSLALRLTLTDQNGCEAADQREIRIIGADDIPAISLVTSDADGHNVISWDADASVFTQIQVLKETNVRDRFVELGTVSTALGSYTDKSSDATQRADRYAIRGIMQGGTKTPVSAVHQTVHTTINRGVSDNQWNLIWNQYIGAEVVTYNILRGSSAGNLTQIASVSSYNTSYTDFAPNDAQPLYAIEYVLQSSSQQAAISHKRSAPASQQPAGRSNVVNRSAARTVTYAQSLSILSANGSYETTADNTMLLLYAEFLPSNTTYKQVVWDITDGSSLADIDRSSGLLTARTPNDGGTVTVQATAVDGSGVKATKQIKISAISAQQTTTWFPPKNLRTEQEGAMVHFLWDAVEGATKYEFVLTQDEQIIHSTTTGQNSVSLDFSNRQPGNYSIKWQVRTTLPGVSDWATATYTIVLADVEEVSSRPSAVTPRKIIRDGHVFILLPDGTEYNTTGQRTH